MKIKTKEWAVKAVEDDLEKLRDVPESLFDDDVYDAVIGWADKTTELEGGSPDLLSFVPVAYRDEDVCHMMVDINGRNLKYVPKLYLTYDLCLFAVQENWKKNANDAVFPIQFVPESLMDERLCIEACEQHGLSLRDVPNRLRTRDVCSMAIDEVGEALEFVPENLRTRERCEVALLHSQKSVTQVVRAIPEGLRDADMLECVENACEMRQGESFDGVMDLFPSDVNAEYLRKRNAAPKA